MKIFKKIVLVLLFILLIFCCYAQYKKIKFDDVYAHRKLPYKYDMLYVSGALSQFESFVIKNYDSLNVVIDSSCRGRMSLIDLRKYSKDSLELNAINYLINNWFFDVQIEKMKGTDEIQIYLDKIFLQYKVTPTYHCIIYSTSNTYEYRFNKNDFWYFFSSDDREHDLGSFLDPTPEWLLPYFEAFEFFKRNPDYELDK